ATVRAGGRLSMKAPIQRVFILCPAFLAHDETTHAGVEAIIGQRADDTETRATVRAVGKRIVIMPVCRVVNLAQAVLAGGEVWQDKSRLCAILLAVANGETAFAKC